MHLPAGYPLDEYPHAFGLLVLRRPNGWPVATFGLGDPPEAIERAAWEDHRRRTLRVLKAPPHGGLRS